MPGRKAPLARRSGPRLQDAGGRWAEGAMRGKGGLFGEQRDPLPGLAGV